MTSKPSLPLAISILVLSAAASRAAVLTGTVTTTGLTSVDLTATSDVNWAIWTATTGSGTSRSPGNTMSTTITAGQSGYISPITSVSTTTPNVQGGGASTMQFSYSNGTSPGTFGPAAVGTTFDTTLDTEGEGIKLSVVGNVGQEYRVDVWAAGFRGQGTMTASLNNATDVVLLSQTYGSTKAPTLFSFIFRPDNISDVLNLQYILSTDDTSGSSSHVGIQAVTVTAIPEASTGLLGVVALAGLLGIRRRR